MSFVDLNDSIIAQVREAADIVDVISQVTPLKSAGRTHKGLCPFHREKTPSFNVDRARGLFYCFGCGNGGDVFKFVMLIEKFSFPEAVEYVANRAGITLPRRTSGRQKETEKEELLELLEDASAAFHQSLAWTPNAADDYLRQRDVEDGIRARYGLGYAPDAWDYLLSRLGRKHPAEKLERAGLVLPRKSGTGHYDRFRSRLMIPIHSDTGTVIGFGGRSLDGTDPKYLNSPESAVFNKSTLLYNLHRAKQQIRRLERAILVEGYFDCISLDSRGVPGVVASMGTSLTAGQASLIARYAKRVIICYDGDNAGRNATLKAAPVLLSAGLHVSVFNVGEGDDPDTFVKKHGEDRFIEEISTARDLIDFALATWMPDPAALNSAERGEKLEALVPLLVAMSGVARNDAAQKVADRMRLQFETVWARVRGPAGVMGVQAGRGSQSRNVSGEKHVLAALVNGEMPPELESRLQEGLFRDPACRAIYREWASLRSTVGQVNFHELGSRLRGEDETTTLAEVAHWPEVRPDQIEQIVGPMERALLDDQLDEIQRRIQAGEELFAEKIALLQKLREPGRNP